MPVPVVVKLVCPYTVVAEQAPFEPVPHVLADALKKYSARSLLYSVTYRLPLASTAAPKGLFMVEAVRPLVTVLKSG